MDKYVSTETVLKVIESCRDEQHYDNVPEAILSVLWNEAIKRAYQAVSNLPYADVKPVVRCKYCRHGMERQFLGRPYIWCDRHDQTVFDDDFYCANGERRE